MPEISNQYNIIDLYSVALSGSCCWLVVEGETMALFIDYMPQDNTRDLGRLADRSPAASLGMIINKICSNKQNLIQIWICYMRLV